MAAINIGTGIVHLGKCQFHVVRLGVLLLSTGLWWTGLAAAGTLYVSPAGTNNAPTYPDWAGAATSPNAAVNAATNGDTVYITNATYILTNEVVVTNGVTVQGYGGQATISGSGVRRCFYLNHTNAVLDTLAIIQGFATNGDRSGYGGGVYIGNGGMIQNCMVYSNYAYGNNSVGFGGRGGGIYIATTGNVFSCLIVSNLTRYNSDTDSGGGGIRVGGTALIRNCTNTYNANSIYIFSGGGMYVAGGRVENCQIGPSNSASYGGGIYMAGGVMTNCVVFNNVGGWSANTGGGGVWMTNGTVQNCIIVSNLLNNGGAAQSYGGGVRMLNGFLLDCAIISNATLGTYPICAGIVVSGGMVSNCDIIGNMSPYAAMNSYGGGVNMSGGTLRDCRILSNRNTASPTYIGGGVYMAGVSTLQGCTVSNNSAYVCGGVAAEGANCVVRDCMIVSNQATHATLGPGGGMYVNGATVTNCTIAFNQANNSGAGMVIFGSALTQVKNCQIVGNSRYGAANIPGGGVYIPSGAPMVQNCSIISNYAGSAVGAAGGGVYCNSSTGTVRNCLIVANEAYNGGGSCIVSGVFQNCTIAGNSAAYRGGGVYGGSGAATNCIIYYNQSASTGSNIYSSLAAGYSCSPDLTNGVNGNITAVPRFMDASSGYGTNHVIGNYRLSGSSPCINAGVNESWMTNAVDLDGLPRLRYSAVDMGAYETIMRGTFFSVR